MNHEYRRTNPNLPRGLRRLAGGDRQGHRRPGRRRRGHAHRAVRRRPRAARRRARAGQDAAGAHAGRSARPFVQPHPVHARPDAGRHPRHQHRHGDTRRAARVPVPARADLRPPGPGRRNQPRHAQDPVGVARSDAGAPGHRRRRTPQTGRAVLRHGHAEPDRPGRHLSAARGAARPVLLQAARRLPVGRGADRGALPHHRPVHAPRWSGCSPARRCWS